MSDLPIDELKLIMENTAKASAKAALKEFMQEYKLEAAHFVWVTKKFEEEMSTKKIVRRTIIVFLVGLVATLLGLGAEVRVKSLFVPEPPPTNITTD